MATLPLWAIGALGGASFLGGLFGNRQKQTQSGTSTSTPTFGPEFAGLRDRLIASSMRGLSGFGGYNLAHNITNQNLQGVNEASNAASTGLRAKLQAMGIRGQAAGVPLGALENARFGAQVGTLNQEPLLGRQFQQEDLAQALGVLGLGRGTSTTSTGTATGTMGGGLGGGLGDLGSILGYLSAQGLLGGGGGGGGTPWATSFPGFRR